MYKEILDKFILQSQTDNLKTSEYQKEYLDLKMKVSFGMGQRAKVPWISFTASGMSTSNGYYPVFLYYRDDDVLILTFGLSEQSEYGESWAPNIIEGKQKISEFISNPPRYGDSYIFKLYYPKVNGDRVNYQRGNLEVAPNLIDSELEEIINLYKKNLDIEIKTESSVISSGLFYMEKQLEDFIIENWDSTELGRKYDLIYEDGSLISQQYRTEIGPIDILAIDKESKNYVVIELKKNQTSDDTIGQLTRYMGWIKEAKKDDNVHGIIIGGQPDKKLFYASKMVPNIELFLYEVNFLLKEYKL